jgi:hypothetical protein
LREVQRTNVRRLFPQGEVWHGFLLSTDEKRRIDQLMGSALLDDCVCDLLVNKRDSSIMTRFGLSRETQNWLRSIEASSLEELAQEIALVA